MTWRRFGLLLILPFVLFVGFLMTGVYVTDTWREWKRQFQEPTR
jgi:hypothetical protein